MLPAPPIALIWVTKNCSLSTYCVQFPLRIYTAGTPTFSISSLKLKTTTGRNIQDHLHIVFFFYLTLISLNSTTNLNNAGFSFSIFNKGLVSIRSKNCFHCLETYEKQVKTVWNRLNKKTSRVAQFHIMVPSPEHNTVDSIRTRLLI